MPYVFRFFDNTNLSQKNENHPFPSLIQGITDQGWSEDIHHFRNGLKKLLKAKYPSKKLLEKKCSQIIKFYLMANLSNYLKSKKRRSISEKILSIATKI